MMTTNGNGAKRKLTITKGLTILLVVMLFIVLSYTVWQMATGGKNEEHLSKVALACAGYMFVAVIAFHGKELVEKLTALVLAFKGIASGILTKDETDKPDEPAGTETT